MNPPSSQRPNRPGTGGTPGSAEIKTGSSSSPGASGVRHRTRAERVAAHFTYPGLLQQIFDGLHNVEFRKQFLLVALATLAMCIATRAWTPPFPFAEYDVSDRDIVCRVAFTLREEKPFFPESPLPSVEPQLQPDSLQTAPLPLPPQDETGENTSLSPPPNDKSEREASAHQQPLVRRMPSTAGRTDTEDATAISPEVAAHQASLLPNQPVLCEKGEHIYTFAPGMVLVKSGQVLSRRDVLILYEEHLEIMSQRSWWEYCSRFCGVFFLTLALFYLATVFLHRRERRRPQTVRGTAFLYSLMVATVIAASLARGFVNNGANLELIPTLLFAQGVAVAFSWELALVLTAIISFVFVLSQSNSIFTIVLLVGVSASVVIHLGRLRSRTKLVAVGSFGALIAFLLTLFIHMAQGQAITVVVLTFAVLNAFWTCVAAFLMTGLLPFIERPCGILTDMSLLELGDPTHPLLHELLRRAPATYSHSLQVASIAETA
ncbi:MAG: hypothetical protein FWD31_03560, partial [Planctomycetaceae bacterium]|nr:hypothetical protein [Planctomycetaceae bacterium]